MKEFKLDNPLLSQAKYEQMYQESFADKEGFWSKIANQQLTWFKNFSKKSSIQCYYFVFSSCFLNKNWPRSAKNVLAENHILFFVHANVGK